MADVKKCANPVCSCTTQDKFCSPQCEAAKGTTEIACQLRSHWLQRRYLIDLRV